MSATAIRSQGSAAITARRRSQQATAAVAGGDAQREQLVEPVGPVARADVAEHEAGGAPGEDAQREVVDAVGELDPALETLS